MAYGLARDVKCEIEGCGRMIAILYEWNGKTVCWRCYEELALALYVKQSLHQRLGRA